MTSFFLQDLPGQSGFPQHKVEERLVRLGRKHGLHPKPPGQVIHDRIIGSAFALPHHGLTDLDGIVRGLDVTGHLIPLQPCGCGKKDICQLCRGIHQDVNHDDELQAAEGSGDLLGVGHVHGEVGPVNIDPFHRIGIPVQHRFPQRAVMGRGVEHAFITR